jgi:hypothetical protein
MVDRCPVAQPGSRMINRKTGYETGLAGVVTGNQLALCSA